MKRMKITFTAQQLPHARLNDEVSNEFGQVYRLQERTPEGWVGQFIGMESILGKRPRILAYQD